MQVVALDTNILLNDAEQMLRYQDSLVVLASTVVQELDTKKTLLNEVGYQARCACRMLASAKYTIDKFENTVYAFTEIDGQNIVVVNHKFPDTYTNDEKIIGAARCVLDRYKPKKHTFVTNDANCLILALSEGLAAEDLKTSERTEFEFTTRQSVPTEVFAELHNSAVYDIVPDHKPENYNYVFVDASTSQSKLAIVRNGLFKVIGKETEDQLRAQNIQPIGAEQLFLAHAIQSPEIDIVVLEARAGTGKTLCALSNAMALCDKNPQLYKSIKYVRASVDDVEKSEEVGFLSGNDEKMAVYFHPFHDALDRIVRTKYKNTPKKGADREAYFAEMKLELIAKYNIELLTGLGMRGRTLDNSVLVIDEFQNNSQPSGQKMITRSGTDTKVILVGSQRQIDNTYITKYNNALAVVLEEAAKEQSDVQIHAVQLHKVIRSRITDWAEKVFTKEKGN